MTTNNTVEKKGTQYNNATTIRNKYTKKMTTNNTVKKRVDSTTMQQQLKTNTPKK